MEARIPARLTPAEGRRFAFTLAAAFAAVTAFAWWREHNVVATTTGGIALALLLAGLAVPASLGAVYRGWMRMGLGISRVTTPIMLGIVFFLILTPTGLIARLFGWRPLRHAAEGGSYWKKPNSGGRSDLTHQF